MPRHISFAQTKPQFRARSKDVTRRLGWADLKPGTILCGVEKAQGLKKGERVKRLGLIRVVSVRREPLRRISDKYKYGCEEVVREGFPQYAPSRFVKFFCAGHRGCTPETIVTRIEFEYL